MQVTYRNNTDKNIIIKDKRIPFEHGKNNFVKVFKNLIKCRSKNNFGRSSK